MLQTFAEASRVLDDKQLASKYSLVATRSAAFLLTALRPDNHLYRSWHAGNPRHPAFLENFAPLIGGMLELYQTDFDDRWFIAANSLAEEMITKFSDAAGGLFDTAIDAELLPVRPRDVQDNATPSGGTLACESLLRLAALTDRGAYGHLSERPILKITYAALRFPSVFGRWPSAADYAVNAGKQIAILYEGNVENAADLLTVVNAAYRPDIVLTCTIYPPFKNAPTLLADRPLKGDLPMAYVCEHSVCKQPVNSGEELYKPW